MKQVLQSVRSGLVAVYEVPPPALRRGYVHVRTSASLISAGTERAAMDAGKKGLLGRARERPELVKQVLNKVRTEGLSKTLTAVRSKLDGTTALGYSASGVVTAVGEGVRGFSIGDRVACAGVGYASHAEMISVPQNLCVQLPAEVGFEDGAFATLGAIAMQGVRLAAPTLGESVVVIGLGLLGQITVQLLRANGCRVFGIDIDEAKVSQARASGADDGSSPAAARDAIKNWSRGRGADAVLITAATESNEPVELAGDISRAKARVIVVGMVGLDVPRTPYFLKELSLQVSMSYGPGRYDAEYEERGRDYPFPYVRWTEGRNIEAFLDLIAAGKINVEPLVTHRFPIDDAGAAYKIVSGDTNEPYLGILLKYDPEREIDTVVSRLAPAAREDVVRVGLIGAGGYARAMLLPHFRDRGVELASIATASGKTANEVAAQFGFDSAVSDPDEILQDASVNLVVIATRHDTHAELARRALEAGKNVFVEKPLALDDDELNGVIETARSSPGRLMVGFNRRFSPAAAAAAAFFAGRTYPLSVLCRVNAGRVPPDSWVQDPDQGGRIVGEVCHFVDLVHYLTGSTTKRVFAESVSTRDAQAERSESVFITLKLDDGSNAMIAYLAEGDRSLAKERIEIFGGGRTFVIDDFRETSAHADGKQVRERSKGQDKGQANEVRTVCETVLTGGDAPIPLNDLAATTRATFRIGDSLRSGLTVDV